MVPHNVVPQVMPPIMGPTSPAVTQEGDASGPVHWTTCAADISAAGEIYI